MGNRILGLGSIKVHITGSNKVCIKLTNGRQLGAINITLAQMAEPFKAYNGSMVKDIILAQMGHFTYVRTMYQVI
jgi:hypothetical protein